MAVGGVSPTEPDIDCRITEMRGFMTEQTDPQRDGRRAKWRKPLKYVCATCNREQLFCWTCRCGFMMCSDCMEENFWGMTCNGITWTCPDCGAIRSFGND